MSTTPTPPPASATATESAFRFVKRNKLRVFIVASLGLHALFGLGWGVPAYVHETHVRAEQEAFARLQQIELQTAAAKVSKANDKSLDMARTDIVHQLRAPYDTLVRGLTSDQQEELWHCVIDSLQNPIDSLAKAMGDSATTEQDLRNLQADLNRQLIETVHTQLAVKLGKWTQEEIVEQVQKKFVPLVGEHYRQQLESKAGKTLRESAGAYLTANTPKQSSPATIWQAIAQSRDAILTPFGETTFDADFGQFASGRLADALVAEFTPVLTGRNLQDPKYLSATRSLITQTIKQSVAARGGYGDSVTSRLKEFGTPSNNSAMLQATAFADIAKPLLADKIAEIAKDDALDAQLIRRAEIKLDDNLADAAYRVATMADHAKDGRTVTGLDGMGERSLTDMREDALARMSQISTMSTEGADPTFMQNDGPPATQPVLDPMLQDAMDDVWKALRAEFDKLVAGKRNADQANTLWNAVQPAMEPDVTTFAQAMLDPSLSKAQMETHRTKLNTRFAGLVREALELSIKQTMGQQLVDQLNGDAGDKIVGTYKDPLKLSIGKNLSKALGDGQVQEKRDAIKEFAGLKAAVDKAAGAAADADRVLTRAGQSKTAAAGLANQKLAVDSATNQLISTTQPSVFRAGGTMEKVDALKTALANVSSDLKDAADANIKGDAQAAKAANEKAKGSTAKLATAAKDAQGAVDNEVDEAAKEYAAAARAMTRTATSEAGPTTSPIAGTPTTLPSTPSIAGTVDQEFQKQFQDQAMKPLVDEIVRRFNERMKKEGLAQDGAAPGLNKQVEEALAKKAKAPATGVNTENDGTNQNGDAAKSPSAGSVAMSGVDQKPDTDVGKAPGSKSAAAQQKILATADGIVKAGVSNATGTLRGQSAIAGAIAAGGPDQPTKDFHTDLVENENAAKAGHGDLMGAGSGENNLDALRSKWLAAAGGADGQGGDQSGVGGPGQVTGDGQGSAQGPGGAQAQGTGGSGTGTGSGGGTGPGRAGSGVAGSSRGGLARGRGTGTGDGNGRTVGHQAFDAKKLADLAQQSKDRGHIAGTTAGNKGASGQASRVESAAESVVAAVLCPSKPPEMQVKDGEPFQPTFKTIRFAAIPFLNQKFAMDGNFDKWKDISFVELLPEKFDGKHLAQLRIEDKLNAKMAWDGSGLYFYVNVIDPNQHIDVPGNAESFWSGDVEEVWIDMLNTKERYRSRGTGQQFWCWPFGCQMDATLTGGESIVERSHYHSYPMHAPGLSRAAKKTADGYEVEWHIPAESLKDAELAAGKIIGINLNIETGTQLQYYWASSKAEVTYTRPDTWGDVLLGGSDGALEIPAKLTGEGTAAETRETQNAFIIGEPLRLRVTDRDMNLNPTYRDKVAVTVRNPRGEQSIAILEETTADSGVFEGSVRTGLELGNPVPATLSVYDGESVTVTYIDQARGNGARNASVTYHVRAALPLTTVLVIK